MYLVAGLLLPCPTRSKCPLLRMQMLLSTQAKTYGSACLEIANQEP